VNARLEPCRTETCRQQQQRERILQAAQQCFIKHGFHAASMAGIAETAGMSAGLIYRYFENKSAIIQAIITQQLDERRASVAELASGHDLEQRIIELFIAWRDGSPSVMNAPLFLEIVAESSRDAVIGKAFDESDAATRDAFTAWLSQLAARRQQPTGDQALRVRSIAIQAFIEGLAIRAVREPDIDLDTVRRAVGSVLAHLIDAPAAETESSSA